tara:strand:+ start:740 stop:1237 length:498 start_codon:yes stop_codon:yes gene_type:complete
MNDLIARSTIEKKISSLVDPLVRNLGFELVRIKFNNSKKSSLQIMVEKKKGDVEINDCAKLSTNVSAILDVNDPIKNEYSLEVSSPGLNRPLTRKQDFEEFKGHRVKIKTNELIDGRNSFKGILIGFKEDQISLEINEGVIGLEWDWVTEATLSVSEDYIFKKSP